MEFKNPIETAREILERTISEDSVTDTEDCVECNEEVEEEVLESTETEEVEEDVEEAYHSERMKKERVHGMKKERMKKEEEDDDEDEDEVDEAMKMPMKAMKNHDKDMKEYGKMMKPSEMKKMKDKEDMEEQDELKPKGKMKAMLDVDDNQDAEGKKATDAPKAGAKGKVEMPKKMKEHVDALFNGEELTEEFKDKAITIFEAAVGERVSAIEEDLVEQYQERLEEGVNGVKEELTEKLDDYLGYVVEEWLKENEVAIENGLKNEIAENFITGLKGLFESCYIDVPDEKYNVLGDLDDKVKSLEENLNAEMAKTIELRKELLEANCTKVFNNVTDGLVDTEVEKLRSLSEGLEFDTPEQYEEKLNVLKENYFGTGSTLVESTEEPIVNDAEEAPTGAMGMYVQSLTKTLKK